MKTVELLRKKLLKHQNISVSDIEHLSNDEVLELLQLLSKDIDVLNAKVLYDNGFMK